MLCYGFLKNMFVGETQGPYNFKRFICIFIRAVFGISVLNIINEYITKCEVCTEQTDIVI